MNKFRIQNLFDGSTCTVSNDIYSKKQYGVFSRMLVHRLGNFRVTLKTGSSWRNFFLIKGGKRTVVGRVNLDEDNCTLCRLIWDENFEKCAKPCSTNQRRVDQQIPEWPKQDINSIFFF